MLIMTKKKGYCPCCAFETIIETGKTASDYVCPRHGYNLIYSGQETDLLWLG